MELPSIKDVASRAGVSVGTVSNVLNHPARVSPDTVDRVQQAIESLGFVRNDVARQLRAGNSKTIALLVLDASNPFFADVAKGAEERASELGLSVITGNSAESAEREAHYLDLFEEQRVRGVLISPLGAVDKRLAALRDFGIPSVLVDRTSPNGSFSSVSVDDVAGGRIAVEHLIASGRKRIGFVGGSLEVPQVRDRLTGAQQVSEARGIGPVRVFETRATTVLEGRRIGKNIGDMTRDECPDALFAANDLVAIGIIQGLLTARRFTIPDDIALIGYDDIDFAASAIVPLTSIRQPSRLMGETALEMLEAEAMNSGAVPRAIEFQPELVVRSSA